MEKEIKIILNSFENGITKKGNLDPLTLYSAKPISPSKVTPTTPLEEINLNWTEKDLPERERTKHVHRLHPYLGKFIPQIVEVFLRKYFRKGQTVIDPFCGSGTTLVQANELGINAVGYDISAFNVLLCRAKTAKYQIDKVSKEVTDILKKTQGVLQALKQPSLWETVPMPVQINDVDSQYLKEWFSPRALFELLTYRYFIENGDYEYKDLLKIILSRSARSARLTTHYDLDFPKKPQTTPYYCYKHSRICYPTDEAFKFLRRYSLDTLKRIREFDALRTDAKISIYHEDSRFADFPPANGVITSPPYVGLIDYHEQHVYAYHLLGLKDLREQEIGSASNGSHQKAQLQYKKDITTVFSRILEKMPKEGPLIVIANDKYNLYGEIAAELGVKVVGVINRHVNRRTGRRSTEFFESVFIWEKT